MNIVIRTFDGHTIVRPDTTWEKDNEDFYPPEFVERLTCSPVLFARISKPGRSIGKKFASRYYDGINMGVLLFPEEMIDGSQEGYAQASCLDHTSFLPTPLFLPVTLGQEDNEFKLKKGNKTFCCIKGDALTAEMVDDAVAEVTRMVYIRTGDFVAIELAPRKPLASREDGEVEVHGTWCENKTLEFKVIF